MKEQNEKILEIAERIRALRDILEIPAQDMAKATGVSVKRYEELERGERDFSFTFLYQCANCFGVDIAEILTGDMPKLSFYTIVRAGKGLPISRRSGFQYQHMAHLFKHRVAEPFVVTAPYSEEEQAKPIDLSRHEGQEFDFILKGSLKVALEGHEEILHEGDALYYDSGHGHGMIATGGEDCVFLALVLKPEEPESKKETKKK